MALPIHLGAWSMALMLRLPFELMNTVCLTPLSKFTFLWVCSGYCFYRALTGLCMKVQPDLDLAFLNSQFCGCAVGAAFIEPSLLTAAMATITVICLQSTMVLRSCGNQRTSTSCFSILLSAF